MLRTTWNILCIYEFDYMDIAPSLRVLLCFIKYVYFIPMMCIVNLTYVCTYMYIYSAGVMLLIKQICCNQAWAFHLVLWIRHSSEVLYVIVSGGTVHAVAVAVVVATLLLLLRQNTLRIFTKCTSRTGREFIYRMGI